MLRQPVAHDAVKALPDGRVRVPPGGRMRILEVVTDPDDIARVLHGARAPPRPPRPHPPG